MVDVQPTSLTTRYNAKYIPEQKVIMEPNWDFSRSKRKLNNEALQTIVEQEMQIHKKTRSSSTGTNTEEVEEKKSPMLGEWDFSRQVQKPSKIEVSNSRPIYAQQVVQPLQHPILDNKNEVTFSSKENSKKKHKSFGLEFDNISIPRTEATTMTIRPIEMPKIEIPTLHRLPDVRHTEIRPDTRPNPLFPKSSKYSVPDIPTPPKITTLPQMKMDHNIISSAAAAQERPKWEASAKFPIDLGVSSNETCILLRSKRSIPIERTYFQPFNQRTITNNHQTNRF
eukprot:TRINITY_DN2297_c0_g1_i4.p1 TRINITY_DN2297_c0_g1~~TRINITY_DN2297_c0_g1_i4.p1  ORF type:complete len:282 (+),score=49.39 TRINITY_DN2297_c0_g1_i4:225-1070(+)